MEVSAALQSAAGSLAASGTPDPAWGFGLGGAVFLVSAGAFWASLGLRNSTYTKLKTPVEVAYAGLAEKALVAFRELYSLIADFLPAAHFEPGSAIADPAVLEKSAKVGVRALRERELIHKRFTALLTLCSIFVWAAGLFSATVIAGTALYFFCYPIGLLWQSVCWLASGVFCSGVILVIIYASLVAKIQASIEHGDPVESGPLK